MPLFVRNNILLLVPVVTGIFSIFTHKYLLLRFCGTCFFHCLFERQINLVYKNGFSKGALSSAVKNSDDGVLEGLWTDTLVIVHCLTFVYTTTFQRLDPSPSSNVRNYLVRSMEGVKC